MNFSISDISPTRKSFAVTISSEEISTEKQKLIQEFRKNAKIKGFRPGKAPEAVVINQYKKEIQDELVRKLSSGAYRHITDESGLKIYNPVDFDSSALIAEEDPATITITVDIVPEFELPNYMGIEVKVPMVEITDEDIDKVISQIRKQHANFTTVERAAEKGDYVMLSYEGSIDGTPIADIVPGKPMYGKQSSTWEKAGDEEAPGVKAVINGVIGLKAGDSEIVTMDFPADFEVTELAGKHAEYQLEVKEVRAEELPEMDETFLKNIKMESLEALRNAISDELKKTREYGNDHNKRSQVSEFLKTKTDLEIPERAIHDNLRGYAQKHFQEALHSGMSEQDILASKDELMSKAQASASSAAKLLFIVEKIAEKENIKAQQEDAYKVMAREAYVNRIDIKQMKKELQKNPSAVEAFYKQALADKVLDFLVENANVILTND